MTALATAGRWGTYHTRYTWSQCRFCGGATDSREPDHRAATCLACGSRQCGRRPECAICLVGILPGWSGQPTQCGYAKCKEPAVAKAPRVKAVCGNHLGKPSRRWAGQTITLADDITRRIGERDGTVRVAYSPVRFVWMAES